jgi:hypothetical protein
MLGGECLHAADVANTVVLWDDGGTFAIDGTLDMVDGTRLANASGHVGEHLCAGDLVRPNENEEGEGEELCGHPMPNPYLPLFAHLAPNVA